VVWAAGNGFWAFVGGDGRLGAWVYAGLTGVFFLGLAALSLRRFVTCALDARSAPAVLEGRLVTEFSSNRGHRVASVSVGGKTVLCPSSRCDKLPEVQGSCRAYVGARSRYLLAVEPRHG